MTPKYVVYKWEDWRRATATGEFPTETVEDAVVLRKQDYFTAPVLEMYRNLALLIAELEERQYGGRTDASTGLRELADYMSEQAEDAYAHDRRLPD